MGSMLKNLSAKEVLVIFSGFGFTVHSQKGSYVKLRRTGISGNETLIIPNHTPISKGTLKDIFNQGSLYISKDILFPHFFS